VLGLARYGGAVTTSLVRSPDALNPVHEAPRVSTNDAAQSSLTSIEILALCADHLPTVLPPPPPLPPWIRADPPRRPSEESPAEPDTPASSRPAETRAND
jgi:hypothetical protein